MFLEVMVVPEFEVRCYFQDQDQDPVPWVLWFVFVGFNDKSFFVWTRPLLLPLMKYEILFGRFILQFRVLFSFFLSVIWIISSLLKIGLLCLYYFVRLYWNFIHTSSRSFPILYIGANSITFSIFSIFF